MHGTFFLRIDDDDAGQSPDVLSARSVLDVKLCFSVGFIPPSFSHLYVLSLVPRVILDS